MPPILQRMRYYKKMNLDSSPVSVSSPSEMISANRIARNTRTANPKTIAARAHACWKSSVTRQSPSSRYNSPAASVEMCKAIE